MLRSRVVNTPLADRFEAFFAQGAEVIRRDWDPYLARYYRKLFEDPREVAGLRRWLRQLTRHCPVGGGRLLDAGCGFGITTAAFLTLPDPPAQVVGLDPSAGKVDLLRRLAAWLGTGEERLMAVEGDATVLPFAPASFDVVFVKDVASHVADRAGFFRELARVLVAGGRLLFTDENNALSLTGRAERARIWRTAEFGPVPADGYLQRPYREERFLRISKWRPELSEAQRRTLAAGSQGMWGDELEQAIRSWQPGTPLRNTADFPWRSPVSGEYLEYLFNPLSLTKELADYGFRARLIPPAYRTGHPLKQRAGDVIAALHPLSLVVQSSFYLVGVKE